MSVKVPPISTAIASEVLGKTVDISVTDEKRRWLVGLVRSFAVSARSTAPAPMATP